jgi:hypothetical protein
MLFLTLNMLARRIWLSRIAGLLGHSQGLFYQIGCDRESVGRSNQLLQFAYISPIGGIAQDLI